MERNSPEDTAMMVLIYSIIFVVTTTWGVAMWAVIEFILRLPRVPQ